MTTNTRDKIIEYLSVNQYATVSELASVLGVTRADVRYHLHTLIDRDIIRKSAHSHQPDRSGRGRPGAYFQLTGITNPDNYQSLATILLKYFQSNFQSSDAAQELACRLIPIPEGFQILLTQRFNQIISILKQHRYLPHWEAHNDGPRIIFENCPYAAILPDFPILCEMDRQFLFRATKMQTDQLQRIENSNRKPPACVFRLRS